MLQFDKGMVTIGKQNITYNHKSKKFHLWTNHTWETVDAEMLIGVLKALKATEDREGTVVTWEELSVQTAG